MSKVLREEALTDGENEKNETLLTGQSGDSMECNSKDRSKEAGYKGIDSE